jgi:hypothetical protein
MLLHIAAEIEHALMVEYLFAAYTPEARRSRRSTRCWYAGGRR